MKGYWVKRIDIGKFYQKIHPDKLKNQELPFEQYILNGITIR